MATKQQIFDLISQKLTEKTGGQKPCEVCGQTQFSIQDKFISIPVSADPTAFTIGGAALPLMPIVCGNCGNTHFINLIILGFTDLTQLKADDEPSA